jgi:hypothetical protein
MNQNICQQQENQLPQAGIQQLIPAINVIVPTQLIGTDNLPTQTQVYLSKGTTFMMGGFPGQLMSQNGLALANAHIGVTRRILWPVGTVFYINNNPRNQCVINAGHQDDILPIGTRIILLPETEISWGGRLLKISQYETIENRTITLN